MQASFLVEFEAGFSIRNLRWKPFMLIKLYRIDAPPLGMLPLNNAKGEKQQLTWEPNVRLRRTQCGEPVPVPLIEVITGLGAPLRSGLAPPILSIPYA
jgi:hypothetical protein